MADPRRTCIVWGEELPHPGCPVVVERVEQVNQPLVVPLPPLPAVCTCECKTCKRAWFADRRPIVRDGKVIRHPSRI